MEPAPAPDLAPAPGAAPEGLGRPIVRYGVSPFRMAILAFINLLLGGLGVLMLIAQVGMIRRGDPDGGPGIMGLGLSAIGLGLLVWMVRARGNFVAVHEHGLLRRTGGRQGLAFWKDLAAIDIRACRGDGPLHLVGLHGKSTPIPIVFLRDRRRLVELVIDTAVAANPEVDIRR